mgnify:CR=1 FL=1
MVTQTITINLMQSRLAPIIMRSEEKGREIQFEVINEAGEPEDLTDYSLKFMMLKPDDNVVYADLASGILTQTEQMTTSKGKGYYCIRILDEDTIIYSGQGPVVIDDHVIDDETLDSISEVDGLVFPDDFATTENIQEVVEDVISGMSFAVIADNHQNLTETWSSEKIADYVSDMADGLIADNQIAEDHTWSSDKINYELTGKAMIDDETVSSQYTWSSSKIDDEIDGHTEIDDNTTSLTSTWSSDKIADEIAGAGVSVNYSTTEHEVGTWIDGTTVYEKTIDCGALPYNTDKTVAHGISNFRNIISAIGYSYNPISGISLVIPYVNPSNINQVGLYADATNLHIFSASDLSQYTETAITIRYRKTA